MILGDLSVALLQVLIFGDKTPFLGPSDPLGFGTRCAQGRSPWHRGLGPYRVLNFAFSPQAVAVNSSPGPGLPLFQAVAMFCFWLIYFWGGEAAFAGAGHGHSTI